jgi:hypothetical protein
VSGDGNWDDALDDLTADDLTEDPTTVENIHRLALELGELDNMAGRVFEADDWCHEREELVRRLETVRNDISAVLDEIE